MRLFWGEVLTAGEGQNPPVRPPWGPVSRRKPPLLPSTSSAVPACRAVALGMQQIVSGDAKIIVAGGQESMSMAPHCAYLRSGVKMGDFKMIDTMLKDGLTDAPWLSHGHHR